MKTTLRKLIEQIDKTNKQLECSIAWEELALMFNIYGLYWSNDTRLKSYYIKVWLCTDTWVGEKAYFLDDELIAISYQPARKADETFEFISKEKALQLRTYLHSLVEEEEDNTQYSIIDNLDDEIDDTYKMEYNSQIIHKTGLYNGDTVEIVKTRFDNEGMHSPNYFHSVKIKKI